MNVAFAVLLTVHGIAHLPGVLVPWRLLAREDLPYITTILGGTADVGDTGIRLIGLLWLLATLAYIATGVGAVAHLPWWRTAATAATAYSLALCLIGWPQSRIGLFINIALLLFLLLGCPAEQP